MLRDDLSIAECHFQSVSAVQPGPLDDCAAPHTAANFAADLDGDASGHVQAIAHACFADAYTDVYTTSYTHAASNGYAYTLDYAYAY